MDEQYGGITDSSTLKNQDVIFKHNDGRKFSYQEAEDLIYELNKRVGTTVMRSSANWNIDKDFIPAQLSRHLEASPEFNRLR